MHQYQSFVEKLSVSKVLAMVLAFVCPSRELQVQVDCFGTGHDAKPCRNGRNKTALRYPHACKNVIKLGH